MMEPIPQNPHNDDAPLREELVAYLDGELDVKQSRKVEERAAIDPQARRILEEFDRTWHLLDELETPPASDDFTRTTLEMVALAAGDDAAKIKAETPRRRWRARSWTLAGVAAACAAGFFLVASLVPDPNAQLLQDLPILENYDQYREIDSIDFLRTLNDHNLFTKDADDGR
jgi:anti-sigma factor RsiW